MADRIGRADYELRADQTGLVNDLKSAEGKLTGSGQRVEKSAAGVGNAFKVASATAALGFGLMTKGALEAERAQGDFMAATGRSREEAVEFTKGMNGLVGTAATVGRSFDEIAAAGIAVSQQFGVTGDEANELTEDILAYSKVVGADAEQATLQLEDTLSAYNLTAADAQAVTDELVASQQKFGTEAGPETLRVLQSMAPALQAMGADMSDGIALMNAFEVAGVDASAAQRGLNSAITNLPEGQTLEGFLAHLQDLKNQGIDPTSEAVEVFGNKAGAALALTLKPGGNALDDFRVSAEDAGGAVEQASEDMLTTSDRIRMFAEKVGGALRGLGQDLGPVASGLGGLATLAAALPSTMTKPLTDGLKGVWTKVAGSPVLKAAIGAAGAAAGLAYTAGMKVADVIGGALSSAWNASGMPGSAAYKSAGTTGKLLGAAMGAGLILGLAAVAAELSPVANQMASDTGRDFFGTFGNEAAGLASGTVIDSAVDGIHHLFYGLLASDPLRSEAQRTWSAIWLEASRAQLDPQPFAERFQQLVADGMSIADAKALIVAEIWSAGTAAGEAGGEATATTYSEYLSQFWASGQAGPPIPEDLWVGSGTAAGEAGGEAAGVGMISGFGRGGPEYAAHVRAITQAAFDRKAFFDTGYNLGTEVPSGIGQGMVDESREVITAAENLRNVLKNGLTPEEQASRVLGRKWIRLFREGVESEIPGAKEAAFRLGVEGLEALSRGTIGTDEAKRISQIAAGLYADGWDSRQIMVALAAQGVGEEALRELARVSGWDDEAVEDALAYIGGLESKEGAAGNAGEDLGQTALTGAASLPWSRGGSAAAGDWISAFGNTIDAREQGIMNKLRRLSQAFIGQSPPPRGPLKDIDKGGFRTGKAWADAFDDGIGLAGDTLGAISGGGSFAVRPGTGTMATMGTIVNVGGITIPVTVNGSADPEVVGESVADKVRQVLDDVFATAERNTRLRWSTGEV
jgi:hypothetical protein